MTASTEFSEFVRRQQQRASADDDFDWKRERDDWLENLRQLYSRIAEYLGEYIESGAIKIRKSSIELNEPNIGTYQAMRLAIIIGSQEIILTPVGTLLIGSKGRVDIEGSAGTSRLVLIGKNVARPDQMFRIKSKTTNSDKSVHPPSSKPIEWSWKIVSRPPAMQFIELNKETLFQILMEVSNG